MVIWIFTVLVYVFFIYGLIEFFKKAYYELTVKGINYDGPKVQVLIQDEEDLEYTIRSLMKDFRHIVVLFDKRDFSIPKGVEGLAKDVVIEFRYLGDIREVEKS